MPVNPGDFIFMREIVSQLTLKGFFQRMPETLREMLGRRFDRRFAAFTGAPIYNFRKRIILAGAFFHIFQKARDFIAVMVVKISRDDDVAADSAGFDLFTRRANGRNCRP